MTIRLFQVDAFSNKPFGGNSAAVCPLDHWLTDELMQQIAAENNLSETAFFVRENEHYRIRWFTPTTEVNLCGHATLASAYVLFHCLNIQEDTVQFNSNSGPLFVERQSVEGKDDFLQMDFPQEPCTPCAVPKLLSAGLGAMPRYTLSGEDLVAVFDKQSEVAALKPRFHILEQLPYRGIIVTAKGDDVDFVCRFFAPAVGIPEDPATGSAFTKLAPYWAERLGKEKFEAKQISQRGADVQCELNGDRILIRGQACLILHGELLL